MARKERISEEERRREGEGQMERESGGFAGRLAGKLEIKPFRSWDLALQSRGAWRQAGARLEGGPDSRRPACSNMPVV